MSSVRCTSIKVFTPRLAMMAAAVTVLPKRGRRAQHARVMGQHGTNSGFLVFAENADKLDLIGVARDRSSCRSHRMPFSCSKVQRRLQAPARQAMCCGKFSAQPMTLGLSHTDMRMACAL
jgi:hypothetical protein